MNSGDRRLPPRKFEIIQMARHFLYLPFYFAASEKINFFNFLPSRSEIALRTSKLATDSDTYARLMDTGSAINAHVDFAITDPVQILPQYGNSAPVSGSRPVVLAAMITNAAFWAVDRRTHEVAFLRDLAKFDQIIAFKEGTTSYGIAHRIFKDAAKPENILKVDSPTELTALTDSNPGTVALSPNLLGIVDLLWEDSRRFNLDLALGTTPEYSNVMVTALVTRSDVIKEAPDVVRGLVRALQRSMTFVRLSAPEVVEFALGYFNEPDRRKIEKALQWAADADVFPATIAVSKGHWMNAARAAADSLGLAHGPDLEKDAVTAFERSIEPYAYLARDAVASELDSMRNKNGERERTRPWKWPWLVGAAGLGSGVLLGLKEWGAALGVVIGLGLATAVPFLRELNPRVSRGIVHGLVWAVVIVCIIGGAASWFPMGISLSLGVSIAMTSLFIWIGGGHEK